MEGGLGEKIKINRTEDLGNTIKIIDEDLIVKEEYEEQVDDSKDSISEIESSDNLGGKNEIFKRAEKIQQVLDVLERNLGDLGVDGGEILNIYGKLETKEQVNGELENENTYSFVEGLLNKEWDKLKKIIEESILEKSELERAIACFLFMMIGEMPSEEKNIEVVSSSEIEVPPKIEINDIEKFFKKISVVKISGDQEYFDIKIPTKPKGHENENWKVQLYEGDDVVKTFDVEEDSFVGTFGKDGDARIDRAEMVIEKDDDIETYEINIS